MVVQRRPPTRGCSVLQRRWRRRLAGSRDPGGRHLRNIFARQIGSATKQRWRRGGAGIAAAAAIWIWHLSQCAAGTRRAEITGRVMRHGNAS